MKKDMKKRKMKSFASWVLVGVLGLFGLGGVVFAFSGSAQNVAEDGGVINVYNQASELQGGDETLGASGSRFANGLSADATSPAFGEVRGTILTITATSSLDNLTVKGTELSTTTMGTATTLTESELLHFNFWSVTPNVVADVTYTLPASSTLTSLIPSVGDSKRIIVRNVTSTGGTEIVFASGLGTTLNFVSTTQKVFASSTSYLELNRLSNTDVIATFIPFAR